jgi:CheY-like chemotaxis protein
MLETDELTWVDPDYLLQALGGNASAAAEMAADLMPCILPAIAALREASAHGDTRAAVLHCHSLRNSASLIGATALHRLLGQHEAQARAGAALAPAAVEALQAAFEGAGERLQARLAGALGQRPRVLVVDDSDMMRRLMAMQMGQLNLDVVAVGDGASAVTAALAQTFDIIFMDCMMPGMDGVATTQAIRDEETRHGRPRTPIVAMSAHLAPEIIGAARRAGMDDFMRKPVLPGDLVERCRYWMSPQPVAG